MSPENHAFTLAQVLDGGFEAHCIDVDGCRYLWHGNRGIRYDRRRGIRTLITQPSLLPDVDWFPTQLGEKELEASAGDR